MKKILQIMSVISLTTMTTINLTACQLFQNSPSIDWNQRLNDAVNLIRNTTDLNFKTFFYDKSQTKVSNFEDTIISKIKNLLGNSTQDYSLLIYHITNLEDTITTNTTIELELSIYDIPSIKKTTSFVANFTGIQEFVNKTLLPYTNDEKNFTLNKKDDNSESKSFYETLIGYGADFKQHNIDPNIFTTSDSGELGPTSDFWKSFQTAKGDEETKAAYLGNVLYPIFQLFGDLEIGGLTFFNFEAKLQTSDIANNVIAFTGNKNFDGQDYDYIKITLKGVKNDDVDLGNSFSGLTYIFK